jgi:hypothetical protein
MKAANELTAFKERGPDYVNRFRETNAQSRRDRSNGDEVSIFAKGEYRNTEKTQGIS